MISNDLRVMKEPKFDYPELKCCQFLSPTFKALLQLIKIAVCDLKTVEKLNNLLSCYETVISVSVRKRKTKLPIQNPFRPLKNVVVVVVVVQMSDDLKTTILFHLLQLSFVWCDAHLVQICRHHNSRAVPSNSNNRQTRG